MALKSTRWWLGIGCIYLSLVPHLFRVDAPPGGDIGRYYHTISLVYAGKTPYVDQPFEYPPYAVLWFALPGLGGSVGDFQFLFALQLLVLDIVLKWWLLGEGLKRTDGLKAFLPLVVYSLGTGFLSALYLQRMDLIPAFLSLAALVAFSRKKHLLSGILLGAGAGTKLYPILFAPVLIALARERRQRRSVLGGLALGLLPIALMSPWVPWWRFLEFHDRRGFEVESLYASLYWLAHFFMKLDLSWSWVTAWREVTGPDIAWLLPYAKAGCLMLTGLGMLWASYTAFKRPEGADDLAQSSLLALGVLLPFVAFNIVLSPQYMIWLLALAAAGFLSGDGPRFTRGPGIRTIALLLIALASLLTPIWYPSPEFGSGLGLLQIAVVVLRNFMLITAWIMIVIYWGRAHGIRNGAMSAKISCRS